MGGGADERKRKGEGGGKERGEREKEKEVYNTHVKMYKCTWPHSLRQRKREKVRKMEERKTKLTKTGNIRLGRAECFSCCLADARRGVVSNLIDPRLNGWDCLWRAKKRRKE